MKRLWRGTVGFATSIVLNIFLMVQKLNRHRVIIFQVHAANQIPHIEPIFQSFAEHRSIIRVVLCPPKEIALTKKILGRGAYVWSINTTFFLLFWDIVIAVDQRMRLPVLNFFGGQRVCIFHGQPTKGNVYSNFNYRYFDCLFFYGPMMKTYYERQKIEHPEWSHIKTYDVGQAKTDVLFATNHEAQKIEARNELRIRDDVKTVLYAPSFEPCASLAADGLNIIETLRHESSVLIVKPHPSFYRVVDPDDQMYAGVPHASEWASTAQQLIKGEQVIFPIDQPMNTETALAVADVLITDHSGIAFDAINLDIPVIYIDCPEFFEVYLPERYGINGQQARQDIACNAGRDAGVVVTSIGELKQAVSDQLDHPMSKQVERATVRKTLLFNQGAATEAIKQQLLSLVS
jgi:hypothetical protein